MKIFKNYNEKPAKSARKCELWLFCCYRSSLEEAELNIDNLESKLEKVHNFPVKTISEGIACIRALRFQLVKLCSGMIEAGKVYNTANRCEIYSYSTYTALWLHISCWTMSNVIFRRSFINGVHDVAVLFKTDTMVSVRKAIPACSNVTFNFRRSLPRNYFSPAWLRCLCK